MTNAAVPSVVMTLLLAGRDEDLGTIGRALELAGRGWR
jgi:hypothetical protein